LSIGEDYYKIFYGFELIEFEFNLLTNNIKILFRFVLLFDVIIYKIVFYAFVVKAVWKFISCMVCERYILIAFWEIRILVLFKITKNNINF
jgi:hypothetical protein